MRLIEGRRQFDVLDFGAEFFTEFRESFPRGRLGAVPDLDLDLFAERGFVKDDTREFDSE